jgi:hypothetical protein
VANAYPAGNTIRLHATMMASGGAFIQPASVYFIVKSPAPNGSTATYGWPANVTRTATGGYYLDVVASAPGDWHYRSVGAGGSFALADEQTFAVYVSHFA